MLVAHAAGPALGDDEPLIGLTDVGDDLAGVMIGDNGAQGHRDDAISAISAVHLLAHAVAAVLGPVVRVVGEVEQGVDGGVANEDDIAALAAIAAIGSALGDVLLAAHADGPVASLAGADEDCGAIEKQHGGVTSRERRVTNEVQQNKHGAPCDAPCNKLDQSGIEAGAHAMAALADRFAAV